MNIINKNILSKVGKIFSKIFTTGFICFLIGNLGIGKTLLIKNLIGFIIKYKYIIKSPTFSIIEDYIIFDLCLYHLDLYKLSKDKSFLNINILNNKNKNSILILEWGNFAKKKIISNMIFYLFNYSYFLNRFFLIKSYLINFYSLFGK